MIFQELVLQNFGPYLGRHTINLSPQPDCPIILIGGLNGGGKTTLMDALRLALYGHRAQLERRRSLGYSNFLKQCINTRSSPDIDTSIELTFEHVLRVGTIDKTAQIHIQRTWNHTLKNGTKDTLQVNVDGWSDERLTQTWDEQIEDWLPLGISNLFLFDGEQVKELAEQATPPPNVTQAIRTLLGLELADRLSTDLTILVSRKERDHAQPLEKQRLDDLEQSLNQTKADLSAQQEKVEDLTDALEQANEALELAETRFFSSGAHLTEQREVFEDRIDTHVTEVQIQQQSLRDLAGSTLPLALVLPLLKKAQTQGQQELEQTRAALAYDVVNEHDQRLLDMLMRMRLSDNQKRKIQNFVEAEQLELFEVSQQATWLQATAETINHLQHVLQHQLPHERTLTQQHLQQRQSLQTDIDALDAKIAKAASDEDYERLKSERDQAKTHHQECLVNLEVHKRRLTELEQRSKKLHSELASYSERAITRENESTLFKASERVQSTLAQYRKKLTERKLDNLETQITQRFKLLLHKPSLVHRITVNADTFELTLYDTTGEPMPIYRLSAGEKQLLAIAFLWALASISYRNLPIAIDTPLGRLDSSHRKNLLEQYFPMASHQVILFSTDTEIGKDEVKTLRQNTVIAQEYLLKHSDRKRQTTIKQGYFW